MTPEPSNHSSSAPDPPRPPLADEPFLSLEEQRDIFLQMRLERVRIPRHFLAKTFDNFDVRRSKERQNIVQMARAYVDSFGRSGQAGKAPWAILYGATGSGKTHILAAILRELIVQGHRALFYNVPNLFKDIRATYDGNEERDEEDLLNEIVEVEILALDDLGAEKTSDWTLDRLYLAVNQRYEAARATLVTTNHDWPDDLAKAVGPRIVSRLAEMCRVIGPFPNEDWRMKNAGLLRRLS